MIADDPVVSVAHTLVSSPGTMALLVGSGISRAADIPTGWDVTLTLIREMAAVRREPSPTDPANWFETTFDAPPDYSAVLERLARSPEGRRNVLERFFEPTEEEREEGKKRPTAAHRAIAALMGQGLIRVVLTTNFDRLLEIALSDVGVVPVVIASEEDARAAEPLAHQRHVVVKLHGDYKDPRIRNTVPELGFYGTAMDSWLDRTLAEFGLIVCGWSGDWDAALRAGFDRAGPCRYPTYWCSMATPSASAQALIASRSAETVSIADADTFFDRLLEAAESLEDLRMQRPTSAAIATATLKRLLAEDRHRIRLVDFVQEEIRRASISTQDAIPHVRTPTDELVAWTVRQLDDHLRIVMAVFFNAARFSKGDEQRRLVVDGLRLLVPASQRLGSGFVIWLQMRLYPASCALYASALGALLSSNWQLLRDLMSLEARFDGRVATAYKDLAIELVLSPPVGQALRPGSKMGASEHLRDILRRFVDGATPDPEDLLNRLEVWLGLAALDAGKSEHPWAAPGRYMLLTSLTGVGQPDGLITEAERAAEKWGPLSAGWFGGDPARFIAVAGALRVAIGGIAPMYW